MARKAAKKMRMKRPIHSFLPRIELPQFRQNTAWLKKLVSFHASAECAFRTLKRFTTADFLVKFRTCNPSEFGYRSLDHLFSFRGCLSEGNYYIYDERSAMTMKACIVATKLGKFSQKEFRDTFEMFFVTKKLLKEGCGFDSLEALLDSIPHLVSIGAGEYEMRSGAKVLPIPEEGRERDATIATEEEGHLVRNSAETMAENEVGHHYGLPKFEKKMARRHSVVDALFRLWRRFTEERFLNSGYRNFKPQSWGYQSFDHLFVMRGCVPSGKYYTYDERTAIERRAHILATNLQKFSYVEFCDNFKKFFSTDEILIRSVGFHSVESLLSSIPDLVSIGSNQYEVRSGADLLTKPGAGKEQKEATKTTEAKGSVSVNKSTETVVGSQEIHPPRKSKVNSKYAQFRTDHETFLTVARSLPNPFTEAQIHLALAGKFYRIHEEEVTRLGRRLVPLLLEHIPGIEYVGNGMFRHDGVSTTGNFANPGNEREIEVEVLEQRRGEKRNLSNVESPESQGEPASKRSKNVIEIPIEQELPQTPSGKTGKKSVRKTAKVAKKVEKVAKKKIKKTKSSGKVKGSKTTRSLALGASTSALASDKKKKKVVKKRKKAAGGKSTSDVGLQGSDEVPGGIGEGENAEAVNQKLKKAEQRLKEVERELMETKIKLNLKKESAATVTYPMIVKDEVTNYVESVDGSSSTHSLPIGENFPPPVAFDHGLIQDVWRNEQALASIGQMQQMMQAPGGYGSHVAPMFPRFLPTPLPLFAPLNTEVNSTPPTSLPPAGFLHTPGTPTSCNISSGTPMNSNEGTHQVQWMGGQMQPMMMQQGFVPGPVPAQIPGFGHFPPPPMAPCFRPPADPNPSQLLGRVVSSVVASAFERSADPRQLTNQLFDAIFRNERQE